MTGAEGRSSVDADKQAPSEAEIRTQLLRILASDAFDASTRNRNFLRFVVEETVAGRAGYIKGYTVAQSVFGRGEDFDPQLDPVVRIEASRLRRSLERYYLIAGTTDPVRIELPKGGYVPRFTWEHADGNEMAGMAAAPEPSAELASPPPRPQQGGPSIIVLPFENLGGEVSGNLLAGGITEELIGRLIAYKELSVICANTSFRVGLGADPFAVGRKLALGFALKGTVRSGGGRLRASTQLIDVEDGRYLWAENFDRPLTSDDLWSVQEEIAAEIATRLGAPYGEIARLSQEMLARRRQFALDEYLAVVKAYGYRRQMAPPAHAEARECLERAVALSPSYFEAWAQLALVHIDEYRFGLNPLPDPLGRALAAAEQAVRYGGDSALAHLAASLVHHYRGDHERSRAIARHAMALNPDNPEVLAQVAARFALSGAWDDGIPLMRRAVQRDPDPPPWNRIILALDGLRREDYRLALEHARAATASGLPHVLVLLSAIYAALGEREQAIAALEAACSQGRRLDDLWEQIRRSIHDEAVLQRFERGLEQIGARPRPLPTVPAGC